MYADILIVIPITVILTLLAVGVAVGVAAYFLGNSKSKARKRNLELKKKLEPYVERFKEEKYGGQIPSEKITVERSQEAGESKMVTRAEVDYEVYEELYFWLYENASFQLAQEMLTLAHDDKQMSRILLG